MHEILTSEIPFLEENESIDSLTGSPEVFRASEFVATIDRGLMFPDCRGSGFPIWAMLREGVSEDGIDFVTSLMAASPKSRALKSQRLSGPELGK